MSFLDWTADLDTGIAWVDEQHREIVRHINDLHAVANSGGQRQKIEEIMESLILYTAYHFGEEEKMLEKANYPLTETHKGVHRGFVDKLNGILDDFRRGGDTAEALLKLLQTWLFSHIKVHDRGYVATVKKAGADMAPA